jgi:hypothetical protein
MRAANEESSMPHDHHDHDDHGHGHQHGADPDAPIACEMSVFSPEDKKRYTALARKLAKAIVARRELEGGYALQVALGKITIGELGDWMSLESRCCRFLEIALEPEGPEFWLRLTGRPGTKEFLKRELGI